MKKNEFVELAFICTIGIKFKISINCFYASPPNIRTSFSAITVRQSSAKPKEIGGKRWKYLPLTASMIQ